MLLAAPLVAYIPLAALGAVLLVVAWKMAEKSEFMALIRGSRGRRAGAAVDIPADRLRRPDTGIAVGVVLGAFLFLHRMAEAVEVASGIELIADDKADINGARTAYDAEQATDPDVMVYRISGALFFGATTAVSTVLDRVGAPPKSFVLDFSNVPLIDITAANALRGFVQKLERSGTRIYFAGARPAVRRTLEATGFNELDHPLCSHRRRSTRADQGIESHERGRRVSRAAGQAAVPALARRRSRMRITILAVPPVIPLIHDDLHLSEAQVGFLMGLPLAHVRDRGSAGFAAGRAVRRAAHADDRHGDHRARAAGRGGAFNVWTLFAATLVMGFGIAIMQPALPTLVREWVPQRTCSAAAMATNGMLMGGTLASELHHSVGAAARRRSWRLDLVVWSAPVLLIALVFMLLAPHKATACARRRRHRGTCWWPDWKNPLIWLLGLTFGANNTHVFRRQRLPARLSRQPGPRRPDRRRARLRSTARSSSPR